VAAVPAAMPAAAVKPARSANMTFRLSIWSAIRASLDLRRAAIVSGITVAINASERSC